MIIQRITLPKYDWKIVVFHNTNADNEHVVINALKEICNDEKIIDTATQSVRNRTYNNGFIYSNFKLKRSVISIGVASSSEEYIDTIIHEANHLQSHIATVYNLDEKGEEVCYLIADIVKRIYKDFRKIIAQ